MSAPQTSAESLTPRAPQVLTQRVIESFFSRMLAEDRPISTISIVSPWISDWECGVASLDRVVKRINDRRIRTLILTRPPIEEWHSRALDQLRASQFIQIHLIPELHAKLFLCEAVPVGFGLIGSANFTAKSLTNIEVAVLFEGRGLFSALLKELRILIWNDLRAHSQGRY